MNVIEQAQQGYAPNQVAVRTDRSVEAQLIGRVTGRLQHAGKLGKSDFPKLMTALHENRRMWTTLAANVADLDNELPKELRAQIFYLAEFTEQHSHLVVKGQADVTALVDINMSVVRGLNGQRSA